jgi:hypothetical protein
MLQPHFSKPRFTPAHAVIYERNRKPETDFAEDRRDDPPGILGGR